MVAFAAKSRPFTQAADSRKWLWLMLRASRAKTSHGFGGERNWDTELFQRGAVCCGHHTGLICSDVSSNTLIRLHRKKKEVEDANPHVSRKTQFQLFSELCRCSCYDSEQFLRRLKKFPHLTNIICPLFTSWWQFLQNQSMQIAWL